MPSSCCAINCTNRLKKGSGITFHKFPFSNGELTKKWVIAMRREAWMPTARSYICSVHFRETDFKYINGRRYLERHAVPSIFNFLPHLKKTRVRRKKKNSLDENNIDGGIGSSSKMPHLRASGLDNVNGALITSSTESVHKEHNYSSEIPSNSQIEPGSLRIIFLHHS